MPLPMTITVLIEDSVSRPILLAEHGLAFWIDMGAQCILFDTGQSHLILANANILGIDLDAVDIVVLSHGHYDHCGGLADVLTNAGDKVTVYTHPGALQPKYRRTESTVKDIGIPRRCLEAIRHRSENIRTVTTPTEIAPGLFLTGEIPRIHPEEQSEPGYYLDTQGRQPDSFLDDQALFMKTPGGTVVVLGCAHAGVINTLAYIRHLTGGQPLHTVLGGMHLHSASDERIAWTIASLRRFSIERFYPMHCTGAKAMAAFWTAFPGHCFSCGVGTTLKL